MSAGTTDHFKTNASPRISSTRNTTTLIEMISAVTTGKCLGRRDASDKGTKVPTVSSPLLARQYGWPLVSESREFYPVHANLARTRRAARDNDRRAAPLNSMLIPTRVPITHSVLDG